MGVIGKRNDGVAPSKTTRSPVIGCLLACVVGGVPGLVIGQAADIEEEAGWTAVDEDLTGEGSVTRTPRPEPAPVPELTRTELEALFLRKLELRDRMARQVDNDPPGPPGLPEEEVPETTVRDWPSPK